MTKFKVYPYNHLYRTNEESHVKYLLTLYNDREISQGIQDQFSKTKSDSTMLRWLMCLFPLSSQRGKLLMSVAEAILRTPDTTKKRQLIAQLRLPLPKAVTVFFAELFVKYMGSTLIAGETVEAAKSQELSSYDMLGESAITHEQSTDYMWKYRDAIRSTDSPDEISVKLSSLSANYTYLKQELCVPVLVGRMKALLVLCVERGIHLTIDAEEQDKLDLSMMVIDRLMAETNIYFSVAVQAYGKRAHSVIQYLSFYDRKIGVRLVKGAYWDAEIKQAQQSGLDYPVFTDKRNTNISYIACAKLAIIVDNIDLHCATHNPSTIGAVKQLGCNSFQRLYGMGEKLHRDLNSRVYKPVGEHKDLLAYLIRRMMENGANNSFIMTQELENHRDIGFPLDSYRSIYSRESSSGRDFSDPETVRRYL